MRRALAFALATGAALVVWASPGASTGSFPFSVHMARHMAVVSLVAPLLALAIAGGPLDPITRYPDRGSALVASMVELCVVWIWHAPAPHHAARGGGVPYALEQASFLLAALFLWITAVGGTARERRARGASGVTALLLTSMHMTLLGALLAPARSWSWPW